MRRANSDSLSAGTLVGFWSPRFSETFGIPGYHFHFLSDDRTQGGHLLECSASRLRLRAERLTELHLALPQADAFSPGRSEWQPGGRNRLRGKKAGWRPRPPSLKRAGCGVGNGPADL